MDIFENLENLSVSEECFDSIMNIVEEYINEKYADTHTMGHIRHAADRSISDRDYAVENAKTPAEKIRAQRRLNRAKSIAAGSEYNFIKATKRGLTKSGKNFQGFGKSSEYGSTVFPDTMKVADAVKQATEMKKGTYKAPGGHYANGFSEAPYSVPRAGQAITHFISTLGKSKRLPKVKRAPEEAPSAARRDAAEDFLQRRLKEYYKTHYLKR